MKKKLPRKQGGLFGVVKEFLGRIESQGKGTLQVHLGYFLAGFPKTVSKIVSKGMDDAQFKKNVASFFG